MKNERDRLKREWKRGWLGGVLAALSVVQAFDNDVLYDEIAWGCAHLDDLYAEARRTGNAGRGSGLKEAKAREASRKRQRDRIEKAAGSPA